AWRRCAGLWGTRLPATAALAGTTATAGTTAPAAATASDAATDCPLRFPGQYHDAETGLDYNYRRYYDPDTGRYTGPDPLGLAPAPNPYGYVGNPLSWLDPLGLTGDDGSGGSPGDFEEFYRTMSKEHYDKLVATGQLQPTAETFVSPTQGFSEDYQ